jgi:hypothetical protein
MRTTAIATVLTLAILVGGCASGKQVNYVGPGGGQTDGAIPPDVEAAQQGDVTTYIAPGDGAQAQSTPPGPVAKVVITEIMANPQAVLDSTGEWFELHNTGTLAVDLKGWTIKDDKSNTHTIKGSVPLAPGGYLVLGKTKDKQLNGGAAVHYAYGTSWYLNNSSDQIYVYDAQLRLVDKVLYDSGSWTLPNGASLSRKDPKGPAGPTGWCKETKGWGGSSSDKGSPGTAAGCGS